ncbi:MAG TPA: proline dehydrogenase family protein [Fimbriimonas sp.]|nr:proline dehydrogenase family protein [Fimbriimonas sp.]
MLARSLILRSAGLKPVESTVRRSRLFRPLVKRFIAGDTLSESLDACRSLLDRSLKITLDYLGENTHSEAEANAAKDTFVDMLDEVARVPEVRAFVPPPAGGPFNSEPLNISIKLTQCGLDLGNDVAERNYRQVLDAAKPSGNFVRVDMESSEYTQRTVDLVSKALREGYNTGTVLQSYLHRTDDDVELMVQLQARVRIVKGAYLEPASVAYPEKSKVDEAFVRQSKRLMSAGFYPAIATHDEKIIEELKAYAAAEKIDPSRYEFQMLYGIRRDLQEGLRKDGYNVRIYVPFGSQWYPYFTRRLAERPANALFILRSLFKG